MDLGFLLSVGLHISDSLATSFFFIERKNLFHLRIVLNLFLWSWFGALSDSLATFFFFY
jgi:hypothetical protein